MRPAHLHDLGSDALVGIPLFYYERRRERYQREHGTYLQVHANYLDYLKLCLENPEVDVWENQPHTRPSSGVGQAEALRKQSILFSYFISMAEQAFIAYADCSQGTRTNQWEGWVAYIDDYFRHPPFRAAWKELGNQFDSNFLRFMNGRLSQIERHESSSPAPPPVKTMAGAMPLSRKSRKRPSCG